MIRVFFTTPAVRVNEDVPSGSTQEVSMFQKEIYETKGGISLTLIAEL